VLQVGHIGLWHALQRFDPERGAAFSSYAIPAITRSIWRAVVLAQRKPSEELTPYPPKRRLIYKTMLSGSSATSHSIGW
jgi:hypothetical protein